MILNPASVPATLVTGTVQANHGTSLEWNRPIAVAAVHQAPRVQGGAAASTPWPVVVEVRLRFGYDSQAFRSYRLEGGEWPDGSCWSASWRSRSHPAPVAKAPGVPR